jgi:hypothetical protein
LFSTHTIVRLGPGRNSVFFQRGSVRPFPAFEGYML